MFAKKSHAVDEFIFQCSPNTESCSNDVFFDDFSNQIVPEHKRFILDDKIHPSSESLMNEQESTSYLTSIQYFLASLCDSSPSAPSDLLARCYLVDEVQEVFEKIKRAQLVNAQTHKLNIVIATLKEYFRNLPNGIFGNMSDEIVKIPLDSPLQITIMYLQSIVRELPYAINLVLFLLCKALKNIVQAKNEEYIKSRTDLLLHFTHAIFPHTLGDMDHYLRAARAILVMLDNTDKIFPPGSLFDENGNCHWITNDATDEDRFFRNILHSLQNLEATLACDDSGVESEPEEVSSPNSPMCSSMNVSSNWSSTYSDSPSTPDVSFNSSRCNAKNFYHFTYVETDD